MNDALSNAPWRLAAGIPAYAIARIFQEASNLLLQPVITLPVLIYLLGGSPTQVVWYAIVAGIASGIASSIGALIAALPTSSKPVLGVLLVVQAIGFLTSGIVAFRADAMSNDSLLRFSAAAYLLLAVPSAMLARVSEQAHEYGRSSAATVPGTVPGTAGTLVAAAAIWNMFDTRGLGPDDLLARVLLGGALASAAAAWLSSYQTLVASQLPFPARAMPSIRSPRFFSNKPLIRYCVFRLIHGFARFADPFILIAVLTLLTPGIVWIGGAVLAFGIGDAAARVVSTRAYSDLNVRTLFTISGFLHIVALIIVAFLPNILNSSVVTERNPSVQWQNWSIIIAALALGASYLFAHTGHRAYIRSISSPQTRDVSLTVAGAVLVLTAFAPIIAVRILNAVEVDTLLQIAVGASVIALLATALIVPPYSTPRHRRGAWNLRNAR